MKSLTVDEFLDWGKSWPGAAQMPERWMLEQMDAEGYLFEIRRGAPYIVSPQEAAKNAPLRHIVKRLFKIERRGYYNVDHVWTVTATIVTVFGREFWL